VNRGERSRSAVELESPWRAVRSIEPHTGSPTRLGTVTCVAAWALPRGVHDHSHVDDALRLRSLVGTPTI